jgi:hypothetical protein
MANKADPGLSIFPLLSIPSFFLLNLPAVVIALRPLP